MGDVTLGHPYGEQKIRCAAAVRLVRDLLTIEKLGVRSPRCSYGAKPIPELTEVDRPADRYLQRSGCSEALPVGYKRAACRSSSSFQKGDEHTKAFGDRSAGD